MSDNTVNIYVHIIHATDSALLVEYDGPEKLLWIPRSVVEYGNDYETDDQKEIEIQEWFALKEGLI